jgi:hypothetical protein
LTAIAFEIKEMAHGIAVNLGFFHIIKQAQDGLASVIHHNRIASHKAIMEVTTSPAVTLAKAGRDDG